MVLPDCARAPVVVAAARFTVMPFPVICPEGPEAFNPMALAGVTVMVVPGGTVQAVPLTTAGVGQVCAKAASGKPNMAAAKNAAARALETNWLGVFVAFCPDRIRDNSRNTSGDTPTAQGQGARISLFVQVIPTMGSHIEDWMWLFGISNDL